MNDKDNGAPFQDMTHEDLLAHPTVFRDGLLAGQVVVVSGGGTGIGLAIASLCARLGASVAVCSRKEENLQNASAFLSKIGNPHLVHQMTIRDPEQVSAFMDRVWDEFGRLDVLVNNAGGQFPQDAIDYKPKGWQAVVDTNLNGTFYMMQAAAQRWRDCEAPGSIVSITGPFRRGMPQVAHSSAARAGVSNLTQSLAVEWAPLGIRVNCISPGVINSGGLNAYPESSRKALLRRNPMRRLGTVMEIAEAVVYIGGLSGAFITGESLAVEGGQFMWGNLWLLQEPEYYTERE